ncbi:class I SAM-dependent methyltransferase [Marinobacter salarius]|uniref:class I SAM-dependent methyltransferase n=1 Tax=Marinobacter salarius TaxID=1420917 RepID=UPI00241C80C8|nr:methyltransferase [Marinobacter salarius]
MTSEVLTFSGGRLPLKRPGGGHTLRAWDAADEQLLEQVLERCTPQSHPRVLIIDDQFGALTLGLAPFSPVSFADSCLLSESLVINAPADLSIPAPKSWLEPPEGPFDLVVMRIPRQLDYLACLLRWVNSVLAPEGKLIAGGMIKHLPSHSADVFGELVNTREVCPARKKARVVVAARGEDTLREWPDFWRGYRLSSRYELSGMPAVFARAKLDIGSRLLLPVIERKIADLAPGARVLDLACGNGVLGLTALARNPALEIAFADVSSQAVASARQNILTAFPDAVASFYHSDGIPEAADRYDLVLLTPPFHEGGVVGDHIALRLFSQVARHLSPGGCMLLVGNRHLGYHRSLRHYFGQVRQLDADPKFVVFEASVQEGGRS